MAKKKKPLSNPARGFATTSVPSKAKEVLDEGSEQSTGVKQDVREALSSRLEQPTLSKTSASDKGSDVPDIAHMSPQELEAYLEDADLENIVTTHASKCKADASKQINRLYNERRQLRSLSYPLALTDWLDDAAVDTILREHNASVKANSAFGTSYKSFEGDEENNIGRLWTLRRILTTLKMPDIDAAMEHVFKLSILNRIESTLEYAWGLQEAFNWYAMNSNEAGLWDYQSQNVANSNATNDSDVESDNTDARVDDTAPDYKSIVDQNSIETRSESESDGALSSLPSSDSEVNEDPSVSAVSYVLLQTYLFKTNQRLQLKRNQSSAQLEARKVKLQEKIQKLERDILFEREAAETMWQDKLRELRINFASRTKIRRQGGKKVPEPTKSEGSDQDLDEAGILGKMFEGDEETRLTPVESSTSSIQLIDFGKWSGPSPRKILEELCDLSLPKHNIIFTSLSTSSYSTRKRLDIQWKESHDLDRLVVRSLPDDLDVSLSKHKLSISMRSISVSTPAQADAYLSTLAIFSFLYAGIGDQRLSIRLPSIWRELLSDTYARHKQLVLGEDKSVVKEIRTMMNHVTQDIRKMSTIPKTGNESAKITSVPHSTPRTTNHKRQNAEEARVEWLTRAAAPAHQKLLPTRQQLPVHQYKDKILQSIKQSQIVVLCADTGAGKSTQVPSFILEHELNEGRDCRILVTQPRRISAISLARRVSQELGEAKNDLGTERSLVGYAIRLESKTSKMTKITFATTGVLLRMIENTPNLEELDYLVLDEVHERTMDLDLLFIVLRKLLGRRSSLKIILMSATVNAKKFSDYFDHAPILDIPGRTFPVEVRYLEDAVEDVMDVKPHSYQRPSGNGLAESNASDDPRDPDTSTGDLGKYSLRTRTYVSEMDQYRIDYDLVANLAFVIATQPKYVRYSAAILIFMPGIAEIRRLQSVLLQQDVFTQGWSIHLLHSSFSTEELERAFAIPPPGMRKIVIATNIAETGITIPDVTAVIDTCKEKIMRFDERRQLSRLTEGFISRSSARQRKGRAARVQEGLCFHLVTQHRYQNLLLEQHVPEMLRLSLQDPILRIKIWNLGSIEDTLTAAIDPPTPKNIRRAIERLKDAGALNNAEELTNLGRQLARLPLEVALGKLAIFGIVFKCLDTVITIIAALSSKSPFLSSGNGQQGNQARLAFRRGDSDPIATVGAYQSWKRAWMAGQAHQFCRKHHLSDSNLSSIEDQKIQLMVYLVDAGLVSLDPDEKANLKKCRGFGSRRVFFETPKRYVAYEDDALVNAALTLAFYPKIILREGKGWRNVYTNQQVSLALSSTNRRHERPPRWLCYYEAMQSQSGTTSVLETSKVPEAVLAVLLGHAEIKYFSGVMVVDSGKVRLAFKGWKQLAAVKAMREHLAEALEQFWGTHGLAGSELDEKWISMFAGLASGQGVKL